MVARRPRTKVEFEHIHEARFLHDFKLLVDGHLLDTSVSNPPRRILPVSLEQLLVRQTAAKHTRLEEVELP